MTERYCKGSPQLGRTHALSLGELSRATRRIRRFDVGNPWLEAVGRDPEKELETLRDGHRAALAARADAVADQSANLAAGGCPIWIPTDMVEPPKWPFDLPGTTAVFGMTGFAPFTVTEGSNEFPPGTAALESFVGTTAGFAGRVVDNTGTSHWYRDWRFEAALPPAPADGHFDYKFILDAGAWWYATTVSLDGWLQLFFTTLKPPFESGDALCDTAFLVDLGWPGDDEIGQTGWSVRISGRLNVRAGDATKVAFNAHVYTGLIGGEIAVRGGFTPIADRPHRPSDPWPPEHLGEAFYHFVPLQVIG